MSIKKKIPDLKIMIVECTNFDKEEKDYFNKECDFYFKLMGKKRIT